MAFMPTLSMASWLLKLDLAFYSKGDTFGGCPLFTRSIQGPWGTGSGADVLLQLSVLPVLSSVASVFFRGPRGHAFPFPEPCLGPSPVRLWLSGTGLAVNPGVSCLPFLHAATLCVCRVFSQLRQEWFLTPRLTPCTGQFRPKSLAPESIPATKPGVHKGVRVRSYCPAASDEDLQEWLGLDPCSMERLALF